MKQKKDPEKTPSIPNPARDPAIPYTLNSFSSLSVQVMGTSRAFARAGTTQLLTILNDPRFNAGTRQQLQFLTNLDIHDNAASRINVPQKFRTAQYKKPPQETKK
jgi:hypothetical protein